MRLLLWLFELSVIFPIFILFMVIPIVPVVLSIKLLYYSYKS